MRWIRLLEGFLVVAVDVQRGDGAPGDVLQDLGFGAERRVDRRCGDVGGLRDGGDGRGDVPALGEQAPGRGGDLFPGGQCLALTVGGTFPLDSHLERVSLYES